MNTQLMIWGNKKEKLVAEFSTSTKGRQIDYQFIEKKIFTYSQLQTNAELEDMVKRTNSPILCTDQLKDYILLKNILSKKISYTLILIPHLREMGVEKLCKQFLVASEQVKDRIFLNKQQTILWGKGNNGGEMLLETLKHFHLFQKGIKYQFRCYLPDGIREIELADMEDVLREYISEGSFIDLAALKSVDSIQQEDPFFYLLCKEEKS